MKLPTANRKRLSGRTPQLMPYMSCDAYRRHSRAPSFKGSFGYGTCNKLAQGAVPGNRFCRHCTLAACGAGEMRERQQEQGIACKRGGAEARTHGASYVKISFLPCSLVAMAVLCARGALAVARTHHRRCRRLPLSASGQPARREVACKALSTDAQRPSQSQRSARHADRTGRSAALWHRPMAPRQTCRTAGQ